MPDSTPYPFDRTENTRFYQQRLPEMLQLENLLEQHAGLLHRQQLATLGHEELNIPLYALSLGSQQPDHPVLAFVGGIHGIERIGTQLLLSFLASLLNRLQWDEGLQQELQQVRVLFCPLVNPVGMALGWRSNGNGVDLMRNAPIDADRKATPIVGGHRISRHLPWYRGRADEMMQTESVVLSQWIESQTAQSPFGLVLDCHSGFGLRDRLWFPYAGSDAAFENAAELNAMTQLFEQAYPHHTYIIEPQYQHYVSHGDLWDYLYKRSRQQNQQVFMPLTLEMGSWRWVKKRPLQLTSFHGLFNPMVPHRIKRTLRRHHLLLEFLIHATRSYQTWLPLGETLINHQNEALRRWYGQH